MENVNDFYDNQLKKIDPHSPCKYRIARYTLGHKQLIILVEAKRELLDTNQKLFMVFEGVEYMQVFSSWEDAPFKLALANERHSFLDKVKIDTTKLSNQPHIFYALLQQREIFIVCSRMYVDEKMPKLYEYPFS